MFKKRKEKLNNSKIENDTDDSLNIEQSITYATKNNETTSNQINNNNNNNVETTNNSESNLNNNTINKNKDNNIIENQNQESSNIAKDNKLNENNKLDKKNKDRKVVKNNKTNDLDEESTIYNLTKNIPIISNKTKIQIKDLVLKKNNVMNARTYVDTRYKIKANPIFVILLIIFSVIQLIYSILPFIKDIEIVRNIFDKVPILEQSLTISNIIWPCFLVFDLIVITLLFITLKSSKRYKEISVIISMFNGKTHKLKIFYKKYKSRKINKSFYMYESIANEIVYRIQENIKSN